MSVNEFILLSENEKYDITFRKGVFIGFKLKGDVRLVFYRMFSFYVMVEYNSCENKIVTIKGFENKLFIERWNSFDN